jgi:hypothetical protein
MSAASTFLRLKRKKEAGGPTYEVSTAPAEQETAKNGKEPEVSEEPDGVMALLEDVEELPIMHGLRRPPPLSPGRPTTAEREPWLLLIERLMARGVLRPHHMSQITGLAWKTCAAWMEEIRQRWALSQTTADQMVRTAELYGTAMEVGRVALEAALKATDGKSKGTLLNVVLKAGERASALAGLDAKKTIEHHHSGTVEKRTTARVELDLGLGPGALAEIGQAAARQLTVAARSKMLEAEVLEGEFVESPAPVAAPAPSPVQAPAVGDKLSPVAPAVSPVAASRPRPKGARSAGGSSPTTSR